MFGLRRKAALIDIEIAGFIHCRDILCMTTVYHCRIVEKSQLHVEALNGLTLQDIGSVSLKLINSCLLL